MLVIRILFNLLYACSDVSEFVVSAVYSQEY